MKLFGRKSRLVIAPKGSPTGLDLSDMDIAFSVKKDLKAIPNVAEIEVFNLTKEHRKYLETARTLLVELHAGYTEGMSLLYLGEMRAAVSEKEKDGDVVTKIQSGDKHGQFAGATLRVPVGKGLSVADALGMLVDAFGVGRGNLAAALASSSKSGKVLFPTGGSMSGKAVDLIASVCRAADLEWSVQDGNFQVLTSGKALDDQAIVLGSDSGLIGRVAVSNKGYVKARCLLIPGLHPGRKVVFDTVTELQGGYRIEKAHYSGATTDNAWFVDLECKLYT